MHAARALEAVTAAAARHAQLQAGKRAMRQVADLRQPDGETASPEKAIPSDCGEHALLELLDDGGATSSPRGPMRSKADPSPMRPTQRQPWPQRT